MHRESLAATCWSVCEHGGVVPFEELLYVGFQSNASEELVLVDGIVGDEVISELSEV